MADTIAKTMQDALSIVLQPIQPITSVPTDDARYFEVLLRINNGTPIAFLDRISTVKGLMQLDSWILQQVCSLPVYNRYAVNVSPYSLVDTAFVRLLSDVSQDVVLEITERHAIELTQVEILLKFCDRFPVLLDDIGEAYSGINRLCTFNFHGIKIDGHLILQVEHNLKARAIVGGLMRMAQDLQICCVCEYVETLTLWECLRKIHAQYSPELELYVQGWAVGMPSEAQTGILQANYKT